LSQSLARWSVAPVSQKLENAVNDFAAEASAKGNSRKPSAPFRIGIWNWKLWAFGGTGVVAGALLLFSIEVSSSNRPDRLRSQSSRAMMVSKNDDKETAGYAPPESLKNQMNNSLSAPSRMGKLESGGGGGVPVVAGFGIAGTVGGLSDTTAAPMIARTVSLSITVKDLSVARASLDTILARHHGYSAQLTVESAANAPRSLTASLRIPASDLSNAISDLKTLGRVEKESQSGEDVSQQHADLAERLKTARATEESFRGILQQRSGKISDVLEVEESIARVRGEIESMEAEQTTLGHRVDFATIDLQLSEEYKEEIASTSAAFSLRFHNAFVFGYRNAAGTVAGIFLFLVEYGPSILIWLAIFFFPAIFVLWRYRKARARI
jgi:hypothetical protein